MDIDVDLLEEGFSEEEEESPARAPTPTPAAGPALEPPRPAPHRNYARALMLLNLAARRAIRGRECPADDTGEAGKAVVMGEAVAEAKLKAAEDVDGPGQLVSLLA